MGSPLGGTDAPQRIALARGFCPLGECEGEGGVGGGLDGMDLCGGWGVWFALWLAGTRDATEVSDGAERNAVGLQGGGWGVWFAVADK